MSAKAMLQPLADNTMLSIRPLPERKTFPAFCIVSVPTVPEMLMVPPPNMVVTIPAIVVVLPLPIEVSVLIRPPLFTVTVALTEVPTPPQLSNVPDTCTTQPLF